MRGLPMRLSGCLKNKFQKSRILELKLKGLNMTVAELYGANNTPYDEVLIKFKDEGLDENDPRKEKVTNFFVIVVK